MESGKLDLQKNYPYYPMYYDKTMEFAKERNFYALMILGFMMSVYLYKKYDVEKSRALRTERMSKLKDLPEHHFSNRGGILIEKQFLGFEKYFRNSSDMANWYKKVYPDVFNAH